MIEFELIDDTQTIEADLIDDTENIEVGLIKEIDKYSDLKGLPSINDVTLIGNKTLHDLGIQPEGDYVEKVEGKGLSTNDYTNEEKQKLSTLENYDDTEVRELIDTKQPRGNYLTEETDPTVPNYVKNITQNDITNWNNKANESDIPDVSDFIKKDVNNLTYYELKTNTGSLIDLEINDSTYVVTLKLKNSDGTIISTDTIDLPLESVVVGGTYDSETKEVVLSLEGGSEVRFSVADLVSGLQSEITSSNKLASDLVDDSNSGNKFVTTSEKTTWNNKQDAIGDLATIRSGASAGATAVQPSGLANYVTNTDYANTSTGGVIKVSNANAAGVSSIGTIFPSVLSYLQYTSGGDWMFIGKGTLENVIQGKGLAYTSDIPTKTSDLTNDSNYVTNTDYATSSVGGVIRVYSSDGFAMNNGVLIGSTKTYQQYNDGGNWMVLCKGTLENVITGKGLITSSSNITGNASTSTTLKTFNYSRKGTSNTWAKVATASLVGTWEEKHAYLFVKGTHNSNFKQNGIISIDVVGNATKSKVNSYSAQIISASADLNVENFYIEYQDGDANTNATINFWVKNTTNTYASWQFKILQNTGWTIESADTSVTTLPTQYFTGKNAELNNISLKAINDKDGNDISTTYVKNTDYATTSTAGLMSSTDKTKLDGIQTGATKNLIFYGSCATGASTAAKVVVCEDFTEADLVVGTRITVLFTNANTYNGQATLNVNSTGAKNIYYNGTTTNARYMWVAGESVDFIYNGTQWATINGGLATTSYYGVTKLATGANSDSQAYALTPRSLYYFANYSIAPYYSASKTYAVGDKVRYTYYIYECITAIETPEAWTAAHWQIVDPLQTQIDALEARIKALENSQ